MSAEPIWLLPDFVIAVHERLIAESIQELSSAAPQA